MPIAAQAAPALTRRPFVLALFGLLAALACLCLPQTAQANVVCSTSPASIDFGTSLTATGTIRWTCTNFNPAPATFTLCTGVGNPSFPGTADQPKLQNGGATRDFNLYVDPAATQIWTRTNPIRTTVTLAGNSSSTSGSFSFYGRIAPGQTAPVGSYQAFFFNTSLGFLRAGSSICEVNVPPDLSGLDFTLSVRADMAEACNLGTLGAVDFGTYAGMTDHMDAAGSVQLTCPQGLAWTLHFDGGLNPDAGRRRMRNATGDHIVYALYGDVGRNSPIPIGGTITGRGTGAVQNTPVYGRAETPDAPAVGEYSDLVIVVLSF